LLSVKVQPRSPRAAQSSSAIPPPRVAAVLLYRMALCSAIEEFLAKMPPAMPLVVGTPTWMVQVWRKAEDGPATKPRLVRCRTAAAPKQAEAPQNPFMFPPLPDVPPTMVAGAPRCAVFAEDSQEKPTRLVVAAFSGVETRAML
jgi:hypothetical protein